MIASILSELPRDIELYGFRFSLQVFSTHIKPSFWVSNNEEVELWLVAYTVSGIVQKTKIKKKYFEFGLWFDAKAKISTNGARWLIAEPFANPNDNLDFQNALVRLKMKLENEIGFIESKTLISNR